MSPLVFLMLFRLTGATTSKRQCLDRARAYFSLLLYSHLGQFHNGKNISAPQSHSETQAPSSGWLHHPLRPQTPLLDPMHLDARQRRGENVKRGLYGGSALKEGASAIFHWVEA